MSASRAADLDGLIRSLSLRVTHHSPASPSRRSPFTASEGARACPSQNSSTTSLASTPTGTASPPQSSVSRTQGEIASKVFATTARGYGQAMRWAKEYPLDDRRAWSIESTGSYGAGLAAALTAKGEFVIEFDHPSTRPSSKDGAKSDSLDAVRAAREILGRKDLGDAAFTRCP
jgi:hypothetical protein